MIRFLCCLLFLEGALTAIGIQRNPVNLVGVNYAGSDQPAAKTFTVETGASPGRLKKLNDVPPTAGVVIFLDAVMGCDGKIGFWQFWSSSMQGGEICFAVYNKKKTKAGQTLVESAGRNCLEVQANATGFMEIEIPPVLRLSVNPSSVVAVEYPSIVTDPRKRVISVESNTMPESTPGLTLGRVMTIDEIDIQTGHYFEEDPLYVTYMGKIELYKAFPSLKGIVVGMSNVLDLRFGENSRSGVAMIFIDNVWGTMCDRWYHEKGWPYLFCAEKDFPDTEEIFFTDTPERFQVPAITPIHLKNPRCKFSQNVTMFSCATHDNVTCNHTNDLFIRCKSKVELRKGPVKSEGIVYIYESNYWGSVCDKNELNLDSHHWAHVACRESGFVGARSISYAKDEIVTQNNSVGRRDAVSMHSPVCNGGHNGRDIKMCRDGPLELRCTHAEDVYVRCEI